MTATARNKQLYYDSIADSFDDVMNEYDVVRRLEVVFDDLLADVDLRGKKMLDAGCGTGRFSERASRLGAEVISVDIGRRLLAKTRSRCATAPVCSDVTRLAFADDSFDVVVSSECIEHTPAPHRAVAELLRVCRPGGCVAITCPNAFWRWSCTVGNALGIRPYDGLENWPGWFQLRRWIRKAGGQPVAATGIHLFPFVLPSLNGWLRRLDRLGRALGPVYVNQAILSVKPR